MRRFIFLFLMLCDAAIAANDVGQKFDLRAVAVGQVVQLIYSEGMKIPFVIDPDVLADPRPVSFRYDGGGDFRYFLVNFLDSLGLSVQRKDGVDFIGRKKVVEEKPVEKNVYLYKPKYRSATYLSNMISPLFKGRFSSNRSMKSVAPISAEREVAKESATSLIEQSADTLIFVGEEKEIEVLSALLPRVDVASGQVMVRGLAYEVNSSSVEGSAFKLLMSVLGGKVAITYGAENPQQSAVSIKNSTIDAVFSALSSDSRFRIVSSPSLRIMSGETGRFSVGQEVPVLGALSYPQGAGQAVQSVEYRSSGVIFSLRPSVHDATVDLQVTQQISSFVPTQTGVNSSPTLNKREVQTNVSLSDGEIIVLGGLAENKETYGRTGFSFLPSYFRSNNSETSRSEILLVLQLTKVVQ